jgi:N-acetylmuramoyl-L-alanine amidase
MERMVRALRTIGHAVLAIAVATFIHTTAVDYDGSPRQKQASASLKSETPLDPEAIREAEQRLADLGYWTGPIDQTFDLASRQALIAFQKVEARKGAGSINAEELEVLRKAVRPRPLESSHAHIEIDLKLQVLFIIDARGIVTHILPVSTGSGQPFTSEGWTRRAITPTGRFTVQRKLQGWHKSPLGLLYYPSYILGGIAIHGNPLVPATPASHGCIRIPMFAAKEFSEMTPVGTAVIVHDGSPLTP